MPDDQRAMRKMCAFAGLVGVVIVLTAVPASAHATFTVAGVPANSNVTLALNVPHERDEETYNVGVTVGLPAGWTFVGCAAQATWTCDQGSSGGRTTVVFTKTGPRSPNDERFEFDVHTGPAAARVELPVVQRYSTGAPSNWIGPAGSEDPAPSLAVVGGGAALPPPPAPAATTHGNPAGPAAGATTTTTVAGPAAGDPGATAPAEPGASTPGITADPKTAGSIVIPRGAAPTFRADQVAKEQPAPTPAESQGSAVAVLFAVLVVGFLAGLALAVVIAGAVMIAAMVAIRRSDRPPASVLPPPPAPDRPVSV